MLAVARKKAPGIEWRRGQAKSLPFAENNFDAVASQFGLMFFEDRRAAIMEMVRVLRPAGRLAIAVWDSLDNTPGYAAVTGLLQRLFGDQVADALRAPYVLGDTQVLAALFAEASLADVRVNTIEGTARFPSLDAWMYTDVNGWTLASVLDDDQFELLLREAKQELQPFVQENGTVRFSAPAHIITGQKRNRFTLVNMAIPKVGPLSLTCFYHDYRFQRVFDSFTDYAVGVFSGGDAVSEARPSPPREKFNCVTSFCFITFSQGVLVMKVFL